MRLFLAGTNPVIFGADLVGEGFLEMVWKNAPGVGLDFEMGAGFGMIPEVGEGGFGMIQGRAEGGEGFGVEGDVEVDAAFGGGGVAIEVREVSETGEGAGVEDDLMKIGGFVKLTDRLEGLGVLRIEGEGVGEVDFRDAQAGVAESFERGMAVVELEGEVAGVVVDADVLGEAVGAEVALGAPGEEAFEKGDGFFGVFEVAERFGFKSEVEVFS